MKHQMLKNLFAIILLFGGCSTLVSAVEPTNITIDTGGIIGESVTSASAVVGVLSTEDADGADTFIYSLVDNQISAYGLCGFSASNYIHNGLFMIGGAGDELQTTGVLTAGSYTVCLQTHDGTQSFQRSMIITVTDDIAPVVTSVIPSSGYFKEGEFIDITITFDENIGLSGFDSTINFDLGGSLVSASFYNTGIGSDELIYRYIVQAGDSDSDGVGQDSYGDDDGVDGDGDNNDDANGDGDD